MSAPKSKLRKILRNQERRHKKIKELVENNRKPGETDEEMEARQKRDLTGWLDMMSERDVEQGLQAAIAEAKQLEDLQETQPTADDLREERPEEN
jgi:CHASE3 domain sensor protein